MATATASKKRKRTPGKEPIIAFPVQLKKKSTGDKTISIGCKIASEYCTPTRAHDILMERRITGTLKVGKLAAQESTSQNKLPGMEDVDHEVTAVIETSGVSMKGTGYGVTLNFSLKEVGEEALQGFSNKQGLLVVDEVAEIADADDDELDADPEEGDAEE